MIDSNSNELRADKVPLDVPGPEPQFAEAFERSGSTASDNIDLSHDALALELGRRSWDRDAKYVASWGKWLFWDGVRWRKDETLEHMTFLHSQTQQHPTDIAGLQGARMVVGSELPKGKTWDEAVIKDLTGGDRMSARFMRGDFFDFKPQLTLFIFGNNMPSFRGVDEAIRARVVLVPFTVTIPAEKRDKALPDKLMAEAPAILRWAIEGAQMWLEDGLRVPDSIAAASQEYFDDEDTLGQFLADQTEPASAGSYLAATVLHNRFTQWSEMQGLQNWTQRALVKELKLRGYSEKRTASGRGFQGLKLRE